MITSKGKNNFSNNTFSFWEWSAPVLQTPDELIATLRDFKIKGRIIEDIRMIGYGYNWLKDRIEDAIYLSLLKSKSEEQARDILDKNEYPDDIKIYKWAEIDEPVLIKFEDGDILGISFDEGSSARISLNTLPWDILNGTNYPNFHANRLFKEIIGRRIDDIETTSALRVPDFTGSHGLHLDEDKQTSYITKIAFKLNGKKIGDNWYSLDFEPFYDFGHVSLINTINGCCCEMHCKESVSITEGFDS